jgi:hypothetical protein
MKEYNMKTEQKIDEYLNEAKKGGLGIIKRTAITILVKAIVKGGKEYDHSSEVIRKDFANTFFGNSNDPKRKEARAWIEGVLDKELKDWK